MRLYLTSEVFMSSLQPNQNKCQLSTFLQNNRYVQTEGFFMSQLFVGLGWIYFVTVLVWFSRVGTPQKVVWTITRTDNRALKMIYCSLRSDFIWRTLERRISRDLHNSGRRFVEVLTLKTNTLTFNCWCVASWRGRRCDGRWRLSERYNVFGVEVKV